MNTLIFRFSKLLLLSIAVYFLNSCKKISISAEDKVMDAKNWFEKNYSNPAEFDKEFSAIKLNWNNAKVVTYGNNYKPVIVPLSHNTIKSNYVGMSSLIIFPAKNGGYFHRVFTAYPELNYLIKNKGKLSKYDFTGVASYWDLKKGFVRGAYTKNGAYFSTLTLANANNQNENSNFTNTPNTGNLPPVTVTGYIGSNFFFIQSFLNNIGNMFGMGSTGNYGEYNGGDECNEEIFGCLPDDFFENPDYYSVINAIENNCLHNLFETLKNGAILPLLQNYSAGSITLHVGNGSSFLGPNNPGQTGSYNTPSYIDMYLNENLLINASVEAAAETMIHEAIHARFFSIAYPDEFNSHLSMLNSFTSDMITGLQSTFPNLSYLDAAFLVYGSLNATFSNTNLTPSQLSYVNTKMAQFLNNIYQHEVNNINGSPSEVTHSNLNSIADAHHNGTRGTKFPVNGCP